MRRGQAQTGRVLLHCSGALLVTFVLVPLAIMLVVSFYHRTASYYEPGFEITHYVRAARPVYVGAFLQSMLFAAIAASASVTVSLPFAWLASRAGTARQVAIMVFVLCVLSLSEVIVAFSWSIILSRSAGVSNLFVLLGLMDRPASWARGTGAVLVGLTWYNLPFAVLMLYPSCGRLGRDLTEAAATMGATPIQVFRTVVLPLLRRPVVVTWVVLFVFTMGALVTPQWLGDPSDWMIANHIAAEIMNRGNVPFGSALAVIYLVVTVVLLSMLGLLARARERRV